MPQRLILHTRSYLNLEPDQWLKHRWIDTQRGMIHWCHQHVQSCKLQVWRWRRRGRCLWHARPSQERRPMTTAWPPPCVAWWSYGGRGLPKGGEPPSGCPKLWWWWWLIVVARVGCVYIRGLLGSAPLIKIILLHPRALGEPYRMVTVLQAESFLPD